MGHWSNVLAILIGTLLALRWVAYRWSRRDSWPFRPKQQSRGWHDLKFFPLNKPHCRAEVHITGEYPESFEPPPAVSGCPVCDGICTLEVAAETPRYYKLCNEHMSQANSWVSD